MSRPRVHFAWAAWPKRYFGPARTIGEALRVAGDLYSTGYVSEASYVAREAVVPLARSEALTDILKWWSSFTRPQVAERDPALGERLHRLAQDLVAGGYAEEAVRVFTIALRHLEEPPEQTIAGVVALFSGRSPRYGETIFWPTTGDLGGLLEQEGLAALAQGVPEGIALLATSRRIAPVRPWPTTVRGAVDLLPPRSRRALPAAAVPSLSRTVFELSWLGEYESALNLGLLLPFEWLAPYTAAGYTADRWVTQLSHRWSALGRGPAPEALELSAELATRGYPAEAAELLAAALSVARIEPGGPRVIWDEFQHEFVPSDLRPGRWSQRTTRLRWFFDRFIDSGILLAERLPPVAPPPPEPSPPQAEPGVGVGGEPPGPPAFHFALTGPRTVGGRVEVDSDVALAFRYDVPDCDVLARVIGKTLEELRAMSGVLDLEIIPHGYRVRDGQRYGRAVFVEGALSQLVVFHLTANDAPQDDAGVDVLFRVHGTLIYELLLEMPVVASLEAAPLEGVYPQEVPLDLDGIMEAQDRGGRDYTATIVRSGASFEVGAYFRDNPPWWKLSAVGDARLQGLQDQTTALLRDVVEHTVFKRPGHPLVIGVTDETEPFLNECVDRVLTAGWRIYDALRREDPEGLGRLVGEIDSLPPGARVSVYSNGCFLPWAILYPTEFNDTWDESLRAERRDISRLWGYRFQIECQLSGWADDRKRGGKWKTSPLYRDRFVTLCLNPNIDERLPNDEPYRPVRAHRTFYKEQLTFQEKELRQGYAETIEIFKSDTGHDATFLYFYCHGRAAEPLGPKAHPEELVIEGDPERGRKIDVYAFNTRSDRFRRRPIVFINACSVGAFSPLTFSSFLGAFRRNGAEGMVASFFPLPIKFAAAFGQEFMRRYLTGKPIGTVLLELRRELLTRKNPLGLLYGLNCALDLQTKAAA